MARRVRSVISPALSLNKTSQGSRTHGPLTSQSSKQKITADRQVRVECARGIPRVMRWREADPFLMNAISTIGIHGRSLGFQGCKRECKELFQNVRLCGTFLRTVRLSSLPRMMQPLTGVGLCMTILALCTSVCIGQISGPPKTTLNVLNPPTEASSRMNHLPQEGCFEDTTDWSKAAPRQWPTVLLAIIARNAEHLLHNYLGYIDNLDYPKGRMAVWYVSVHMHSIISVCTASYYNCIIVIMVCIKCVA